MDSQGGATLPMPVSLRVVARALFYFAKVSVFGGFCSTLLFWLLAPLVTSFVKFPLLESAQASEYLLWALAINVYSLFSIFWLEPLAAAVYVASISFVGVSKSGHRHVIATFSAITANVLQYLLTLIFFSTTITVAGYLVVQIPFLVSILCGLIMARVFPQMFRR
ncbi:MAG: hypothetical protein KA500_02250 [Rhodoluna sp.]|nr:hypothetical protein [Rhodoluna sp.]MBP6186249.1 hypothetical protein [Rhodoluna sp.]